MLNFFERFCCSPNSARKMYLDIIIDDTLRFDSYINYLRLKLKKQLGFYSCFSFNARKKLVSGTFLPILDYGDVVYQHASSYLLASLEAVYHGALRFITDCKCSTHHCILYNRVAWSSLAVRRQMHWYIDLQSYSGFFAILSLLFDSPKSGC